MTVGSAVRTYGQLAVCTPGWMAVRMAWRPDDHIAVKLDVWPDGCIPCQPQYNLICVVAMIIAIVNSKGGVGKSTIAVHLAGYLCEQGYSVTLADCDAQGSSSEWIAAAAPKVKAVRLISPDDILNNLPILGEEVDFVVADGPGSDAETSRALLLRADFAVVPCKASMLEVRALTQATEVLRQSQDIRAGHPKAVIALSMVGKNYRLTGEMKKAAAKLDLPLAKTAVVLRQIYADAPGQGLLVWEYGAKGREAGDEIRSLFRELFPERKPKNKPSAKRRPVRTKAKR